MTPGMASYTASPAKKSHPRLANPTLKASRSTKAIRKPSAKVTSYMDPTLSKMNLYAAKNTLEPALALSANNPVKRPKSAEISKKKVKKVTKAEPKTLEEEYELAMNSITIDSLKELKSLSKPPAPVIDFAMCVVLILLNEVPEDPFYKFR